MLGVCLPSQLFIISWIDQPPSASKLSLNSDPTIEGTNEMFISVTSFLQYWWTTQIVFFLFFLSKEIFHCAYQVHNRRMKLWSWSSCLSKCPVLPWEWRDRNSVFMTLQGQEGLSLTLLNESAFLNLKRSVPLTVYLNWAWPCIVDQGSRGHSSDICALLSTGSQFRGKQFQSFNLIPTSCDFTSLESFIKKPFLPPRARVAVHYCNRRGHVGFTLCLLCIVFRPSERCWHAAGRPSTDARNAFSSDSVPCSGLVTSVVSL